MNLRQAAQQALDALEAETSESWECNSYHPKIQPAITALKQALAEPRPIQECYGDCPTNPQTCPNPCNFEGRPKPEQEPISLNNGRLTQYPNGSIGLGKPTHKPQTTHWEGCEAVHPECKATPRKPLTDEGIWNTYKNLWMFHPAEQPRLAGDVLKFARAIERKHGIGEQHE